MVVYEEVMERVNMAGDRVEGMRAFAAKRDPKFPNRWPSAG